MVDKMETFLLFVLSHLGYLNLLLQNKNIFCCNFCVRRCIFIKSNVRTWLRLGHISIFWFTRIIFAALLLLYRFSKVSIRARLMFHLVICFQQKNYTFLILLFFRFRICNIHKYTQAMRHIREDGNHTF